MPIYKRCDSCGSRLPPGVKCKCKEPSRQREYDASDRNRKSDAFYHSNDWTVAREMAKEYYHGLDIIELFENDKIVHGKTVHHIVPIKDDWNMRLDKDNLIYLTESNHQLIHRRMECGEKEEVIHWLKSLITRWNSEIYGT